MRKTKVKMRLKNEKAITLIALVIAIVLNCCKAAMERISNKQFSIENNLNLLYNKIM